MCTNDTLMQLIQSDDQILKRIVTDLYDATKNIQPKALFKASADGSRDDLRFKKWRQVLIKAINNEKADSELKTICIKLLCRIGLVRASAEDLILACQFQKEHKVDLTNDIQFFFKSSEVLKVEDPLKNEKIELKKGDEENMQDKIDFADYGHATNANDEWCTNGHFHYNYSEVRGLWKGARNHEGKWIGAAKVNPSTEKKEVSLLMHQGRLLIRHAAWPDMPFQEYDPEILEPLAEQPKFKNGLGGRVELTWTPKGIISGKEEIEEFVPNDDEAWTLHDGFDFERLFFMPEGNFETKNNWADHFKDLRALKDYVIEKGYSGVTLKDGNAHFKRVHFVLTQDKLVADSSGAQFWAYDPTKDKQQDSEAWALHESYYFKSARTVAREENWVKRFKNVRGLKDHMKEKGYNGVEINYQGGACFVKTNYVITRAKHLDEHPDGAYVWAYDASKEKKQPEITEESKDPVKRSTRAIPLTSDDEYIYALVPYYEEGAIKKIVCETYLLVDSQFTRTAEVTLMKGDGTTPYVGSKRNYQLEEGFLKATSIACNGKILLLNTPKKTHYFAVHNGKRLNSFQYAEQKRWFCPKLNALFAADIHSSYSYQLIYKNIGFKAKVVTKDGEKKLPMLPIILDEIKAQMLETVTQEKKVEKQQMSIYQQLINDTAPMPEAEEKKAENAEEEKKIEHVSLEEKKE